ncbi:MAG: shikimate kinase [Tissierellales bacterium]
MSNIVLIGMSGAGKTTIGKYLAKKLNMTLVDTDDIIVKKTGSTIDEIFNNRGEKYFRELEKKVVEEVSKYDSAVITTGGGVVLNRTNIDCLRNNGVIFLLQASVETLYNNLKREGMLNDHRPLLKGPDLKKRLEKLYKERKNLYISSADYIIQVDGKAVDEIGNEIIFIFESLKPL